MNLTSLYSLAENFKNGSEDIGREPGEIHLLENFLVPRDEKLRGLLQLGSVIEIAPVEHVHHVLGGQQLDSGLLHLELQRGNVVGICESEEALEVLLEDLLGDLPGIEEPHEGLHHFFLERELDLPLLPLLGVPGHHGLQWAGLGRQDHAVAGEPGPFLTEDGEVQEVVFLVVVAPPHHGGLPDGVKPELGLDPGKQ